MEGNADHRVLLAGATGYIGQAVARELLRRRCAVTALVRGPIAHRHDGGSAEALQNCDLRRLDLADAAAADAGLCDIGADAVISCMASRSGVPEDAWAVDHRANLNLLTAARRAGVRHFVLLSAICVQRPRLAFQHAKLAFEAALRESGMDYSVVRPTAFFKSLAGQVSRVRQGKPFLLFGDGELTACKPIGAQDLACYLADCLTLPDRHNRILPIGGPGEALTPRRQGELLFEAAGLPPRFRHVPVQIFDLARGLLTPLGRLSPRWADRAELANIGRYYATESMLLWDEARGAYDAEATPAWGSETLADFYRHVLREGLAGHELGAHKVF